MFRTVTLIACVGFLILWLRTGACAGEGSPRISCAESTHHFGTITNATTLTHKFELRNVGTADLVISRVRGSCGCSRAAVKEKRIPPGATTRVEVVLDLKGRLGRERITTYVFSNDPGTPYLALRLHGTLVRDVEVRPASVAFDLSKGMRPEPKKILILSGTGRTFAITNVVTSGTDFFRTELRSIESGGYELGVIVNEDFLASELLFEHGRHITGSISMTTDCPSYRNVVIPVSMYVPAPVSVVPQTLLLPRSPAETVTRFVHVRSGAGEISIESVKCPDPGMHTEVTKLKSGLHRVRIDGLRYQPDLDKMTIRIVVNSARGLENYDVNLRAQGDPGSSGPKQENSHSPGAEEQDQSR